MEIRTKHVSDPAEETDGYRVLVERTWPEGVPRERLVLDAWASCLAPSLEVAATLDAEGETAGGDGSAGGGKGAAADDASFEDRYRRELDASQRACAYVHSLQDGDPETVTLVHAEGERAHAAATALASWLAQKWQVPAPVDDGRPAKTPGQSSVQSVHTVVHDCMNGEDRLFGGRLMEWIDDIAGVCARRHCGGSITTASVDTLQFLHPAFLNDIVILKARPTYVGRTSLEIRVDSYVEDVSSGAHRLINTAYLTEVFMGSGSRPSPIAFGLRPATMAEREEYERARRRIAERKERAKAGY